MSEYREPVGCILLAIHEAGHAVIAAHLRVPFRSVTIRPTVEGEKTTSEGHMRLILKERTFTGSREARIRKLLHNALVTVAGRVAQEELGGLSLVMSERDTSEEDERDLHHLAEELGLPTAQFESWREYLRDEVRTTIRTVPCVREAINRLEQELRDANKGVSSKRVREILRDARKCEDAWAVVGPSGRSHRRSPRRRST